jgi:hypothetical protein
MPKLSASNDGRASVLATFCRMPVQLTPRRLPIRAKSPLFSLWRDYDPSRIALWHGNGDFGRHAWRDHAELPDSVAELPFGCRGGLLARRFRYSRSGLGRTAYRQGPESGNEHTETSCKTLHRQSETHQPPARRRFRPPSAPIRSRMPPCSGQSRPSPSGGREDAASLDSPCARRLRDSAVGTEECSRRGSNQRMGPNRTERRHQLRS